MLKKAPAFLAGLALLLCTMAVVRTAQSADYPTRPVTLVVAFTPGGASDVLARILARSSSRSGAADRDRQPSRRRWHVAADGVAHAAPDGYTLLNGNNSILATNAGALQEDQFRSGGGLRPDRPDRLAGQYPGGQSGAAGDARWPS